MTSLSRILHPSAALIVRLLIAVALATPFVFAVSAVHGQRRAEQRACRAELAAIKARQPHTATFFVPADPCRAVEIVTR